MEREFDLVLMGATGFTGRLVADYLLEHYGCGDSLNWAIAGRSQAKLETIRMELQGYDPEQPLPILVADSADEDSLNELAQRSRVVCSTVGPYALYGSALVEACARFGTHYCDLTGEVQWMHRMIEQHQATAAASGARIVHSCGFDCIPSDLGTYFMQEAMLREHGVASNHVKFRVEDITAAVSGGTLASIMNMMDEAAANPKVRKIVADPYALLPAGSPRGPDGPDQATAVYDEDFQCWTAPFVMAAVNTRVVRRSNALLDFRWGEDFRYDEAVLVHGGTARLAATGNALAMQTGQGFMAIGPVRKLAQRWMPKPGEGPSKKQRERGHYDIRLHAAHPEDAGKNLLGRVTGDMDPGYGSTSKMLAEAAVCLAQDELNVSGGLWTPASAMGDALIQRLQQKAGLTFALETV